MEIKIQEIGCYLFTFGHSHLNSWNQFIAWAEYAQNSPSALYGSQPLPVRTPLPATSVPLVWRTFGGTSSHSLVPREWEGLRLSTSTSSACSTMSQTSCGCPKSHHSHLPPRTEGMALHQGHPTKTSLQKAESQIHWSLPHYRQVNPVTYELKLLSQYRILIQHSMSLKPYLSPVSPVFTEPGPVDKPPLPVVLEDGTVYSIKEILSSQRRGG